ncbi:hypothetical protein SLS64_001767 [Diaporthe eres]
MASPATADWPATSKETIVDENGIMRTDARHDQAVDMDEKHNKDNGAVDSESSDHEQPQKEFKEGGYGWVVVIVVFLINFHTWGMNSIGVVLETAAFIGASFTSEQWHLILSQGIAFGAGMGFLFTGSVGLVPQWFHEKRSLANSIGTSGSGFGGLTYSLAAHAMIENLGLPWAFRILAILAFAVNGVCSFLARDRNKEVGAIHQAFHKDLFKRMELYLYLAWGFFSILGYIVVVFSLASYASTVGFTANQGSIIAAIFNLSQGLGRPVIGLLSDKVGRINIAALGSLIAGLAAFFLWIFAAKHFAGAIVYSLFGAFAGCIWPCVAPVAVEVVGLQLLPSVMSITWLVLVLPATFAEVIGLSLVEPGSDGYLHVQVYTGAMFVSAFAARESQ